MKNATIAGIAIVAFIFCIRWLDQRDSVQKANNTGGEGAEKGQKPKNAQSIGTGDHSGGAEAPEANRDGRTVEPKSRVGKTPIEKYTFWLVVFNALLAVIIGIQAWTAIIGASPVVVISDLRLNMEKLDPSQELTGTMELKNPTSNTAFITDFKQMLFDETDLPADLRPTEAGIRGSVTAAFPRHIELEFGKPPADRAKGVNDGTLRLWILGSFTYHGRLGFIDGPYTVRFCFYYAPERGRGPDSFYRCERSDYDDEE